jgi:hypothetical protein
VRASLFACERAVLEKAPPRRARDGGGTRSRFEEEAGAFSLKLNTLPVALLKTSIGDSKNHLLRET